MPTSVIGFVTELPPTAMSPLVRASRPATISISVLLPQPEAPTTETNSPAAMSTLTSFSARNGLSVSSPKIFETLPMLIGTPDSVTVSASTAVMLGERRLDADAVSGTLDTSSALRPRCTMRSSCVYDRDVEGRDRLRGPGLGCREARRSR